MTAEDYRKKIEDQILALITEKLKAGQMDAQRAKEISAFVLRALQPHMTIEEIHQVVLKFDDHFPELLPILIPIIGQYDEKIKKTVLAHVEALIRQKNYNKATE